MIVHFSVVVTHGDEDEFIDVEGEGNDYGQQQQQQQHFDSMFPVRDEVAGIEDGTYAAQEYAAQEGFTGIGFEGQYVADDYGMYGTSYGDGNVEPAVAGDSEDVDLGYLLLQDLIHSDEDEEDSEDEDIPLDDGDEEELEDDENELEGEKDGSLEEDEIQGSKEEEGEDDMEDDIQDGSEEEGEGDFMDINGGDVDHFDGLF